MREAVRLTLVAVALSLAARAASAQPQQPRSGHEGRCRAYALEYLGPSPDKIHLTVRQEAEAQYLQARKYLRLCGDLDNGDAGRARDIVAGHDAAESIDRLLAAVRNPGGVEAKDPETYAAVAAAYEVRYKGLVVVVERVPGEQSVKERVKKEADDLADLLIDLYARAVSACGEDAKGRERKAAWSVRLTEVYKSRHGGSDAGLREYVAGALTKPLPGRWLQWWMANSL